MRYWFRGKPAGLAVFLAIAALVAGGLGWVTAAALRLEREQLEARAQAKLSNQLQLALWRLDSRVSPALAREDSRPYHQYSAVFAPSLALRSDGNPWPAGSVLELSPLLGAELPDWMLLHFQAGAETGWCSPQVLSRSLVQRLSKLSVPVRLTDVTPERRDLLAEMSKQIPAGHLLAAVQERGDQFDVEEDALMPSQLGNLVDNQLNAKEPQRNQFGTKEQMPQSQGPFGKFDPEYATRSGQQALIKKESKAANPNDDMDVIIANLLRNGESWFSRNPVKPTKNKPATVGLGPMGPLWLNAPGQPRRLVLARLVQIGEREFCQGIVLDWQRLQAFLADEVHDLFPQARVEPVREETVADPERTMTALPFQLDPGPDALEVAEPGWMPLRVGLALAWAAALVALLAVGLGGWSLLDLSERRIRFVSAVTHELRTPLTTLRLYLDMLTGGLVRDEGQKTEYLHTLNTETDRLSRLVGNVLDFSRLENQRPKLEKRQIALGNFLEQVRSTWQARCQGAGKELVVETGLAAETKLCTDVQLVQQILGNLIDNACKYSREAKDPHIRLRVQAGRRGRLAFEVEDHGPGVPPRERRSIFRPFRRGRGSDVTAGGVGLGLALSQRWARLLGGHLVLRNPGAGTGACFRLEL